mmetsp:Transcript_105812/g.329902  ORF Transcript_105812/g.329902 Transcript_105812/m.329902 type:complete len:238 (+) Transcript_105812:209-922(+)
MPATDIETNRVYGLLIRDFVEAELKNLAPNDRLGDKWWTDALCRFGDSANGLGTVVVPDAPVSDGLLAALATATHVGNRVRTNTALSQTLAYGAPLSPKEFLGTFKALDNARSMIKLNKDLLHVEFLQHAVPHEKAKEHYAILQAGKVLFDSALCFLFRPLPPQGNQQPRMARQVRQPPYRPHEQRRRRNGFGHHRLGLSACRWRPRSSSALFEDRPRCILPRAGPRGERGVFQEGR